MIDRRQVMVAGLALAAAPALAVDAPPQAGVRRLDPRLDRIVAPGTVAEVVATGIRWAEGPVWLADEDALLFSDPPGNVVRRWTRATGARAWLSPSGAAGTDPALVREPGANGLALDPAGRLLVADSGGRAIVRVDRRSKARTVLADRYRGRRFNSPNDLVVAPDGAILFTDPPYGLAQGDESPLKEQPVNGVYRRAPDGTVTLLDGTLTRPNGIALSPGGRTLYVSVSDPAAPRLYAYALDAAGRASGRRVLVDFAGARGAGLPDGMKVAADGTILATGPGGLHILTPAGGRLGLVAAAEGPIANVAIGGGALWLANDTRILRLPLVPGAFGGGRGVMTTA